MSNRDERIRSLFAEIDAIYAAMADRNGLLTDAEFDAIQTKHAEIDRLLDSPTNNTPTA